MVWCGKAWSLHCSFEWLRRCILTVKKSPLKTTNQKRENNKTDKLLKAEGRSRTNVLRIDCPPFFDMGFWETKYIIACPARLALCLLRWKMQRRLQHRHMCELGFSNGKGRKMWTCYLIDGWWVCECAWDGKGYSECHKGGLLAYFMYLLIPHG